MKLFKRTEYYVIVTDKETRDAVVRFAKIHRVKKIPIGLVSTGREHVVTFASKDGREEVFASLKAKYSHLYDVDITPDVIFIRERIA